ncbi:MAG: hypothetical protein PHC64_08715 [Candidatus Gastranaerophilales bacterium]|nr:hypothetical protein [Candidatus Gastranaerophilales bacterium]
MKIYPLQPKIISFKAKNSLNDGVVDGKEETVAIAAGAGGAAVTSKLASVNNYAARAGKASGSVINAAADYSRTAASFTKGISKFFRPLERALTSSVTRGIAGFAGGALAFGTTVFGLVQTTSSLGELAAEKK